MQTQYFFHNQAQTKCYCLLLEVVLLSKKKFLYLIGNLPKDAHMIHHLFIPLTNFSGSSTKDTDARSSHNSITLSCIAPQTQGQCNVHQNPANLYVIGTLSISKILLTVLFQKLPETQQKQLLHDHGLTFLCNRRQRLKN